MARGSRQATDAANTAANLASNLEGRAAQSYGFVMPELQAEAANPQGFGPQTMAQMNTAAQQTAGGTQAGAEGKGALLASRLKNPGAANAAVAESSRGAGEQLSKANQNTEIQNALLKERQRQSGLSGVENLTGLNTRSGIESEAQIAPDLNAYANTSKANLDWAQFITDAALKVAGMAGA